MSLGRACPWIVRGVALDRIRNVNDDQARGASDTGRGVGEDARGTTA